MSFCLLLHPAARSVFKRLDKLAASGDYEVELLDQLRLLKGVGSCKATAYYLASLYLHCGDEETASALLADQATAHVEMKSFFQVLSFCRRHNYSIPKLTRAEESCIDFIDQKLNPVDAPLASLIVDSGGFSVVGNAPGPEFTNSHEGVRFYFNRYQSNTRITEKATVHVATPSWDLIQEPGDCKKICITGNDIFHRRSRVWQRLIDNRHSEVIYTAPRSLWRALYRELGTSPSAGLLMIAFVADVAERYPRELSGCVAGFSNGQPAINHDYDAQPAATRHNWELETVIRNRLIIKLEACCARLTVEP